MSDTSRTDTSQRIRHVSVFGESGVRKTCCDDANLYITCHVTFVNKDGFLGIL